MGIGLTSVLSAGDWLQAVGRIAVVVILWLLKNVADWLAGSRVKFNGRYTRYTSSYCWMSAG